MTSRYRAGADFERKVRKALEAQGAVYVCRSAGSKGPVDLIAFYGTGIVLDFRRGYARSRVEFIQCKRGRISRADRWALVELAAQCGAVPVLATPGGRGEPVVFEVLEREEKRAA